MKSNILIIALVLVQYFSYAQRLFFIGEKSYPSTVGFTLKSNAKYSKNDLSVLFAKDNDKGLIVLSTTIMGMHSVRIKGKILIYLDDGTVITCIDRNKFDAVDNEVATIYYLTTDELKKLRNSNIHTIRYTLKCYGSCTMSTEEGSFSASNRDRELGNNLFKIEKTYVPDLIKKLFDN